MEVKGEISVKNCRDIKRYLTAGVIGISSIVMLTGCSIEEYDPTRFMAQQSTEQGADSRQGDGTQNSTEQNEGSDGQLVPGNSVNSLATVSVICNESFKEDIKILDGLEEVANTDVQYQTEDKMKIRSNDDLLSLAKNINQQLQSDSTDGIVLVIKSAQLEEIAYFITMTEDSDKPVVFLSEEVAMETNASGKNNLYDAVRIASAKESRERGVLVLDDGKIYGAETYEYIRSVTGETVKSSGDQAPDRESESILGNVTAESVVYVTAVNTKNSQKQKVDISAMKTLPTVAILHDSVAMDKDLLENAFAGYDGIVLVAARDGLLSDNTTEFIEESVRKPVIVRTSRDGEYVERNSGFDDDGNGTIAAGSITPQEAKILLMLSLAEKTELVNIQSAFVR